METDDKLEGLTLKGYSSEEPFDVTQFDAARIVEIRETVRKWFRKMKNFNYRQSSYSLKHSMERYLGRERIWNGTVQGYVTNGELIFAMILEGFDVQKDGVNAFFNISEVDFDAFNVAGSIYGSMWHIPHTHVTLRRLIEVEPESIKNYSAGRYRIIRKGGFENYRPSVFGDKVQFLSK